VRSSAIRFDLTKMQTSGRCSGAGRAAPREPPHEIALALTEEPATTGKTRNFAGTPRQAAKFTLAAEASAIYRTLEVLVR
jgi:hypothetical protein